MIEIIIGSIVIVGVVLAFCWPPSEFQWYRKARKGSWAQCTGYFWGKRWFRIGRWIHNDAKEWWI